MGKKLKEKNLDMICINNVSKDKVSFGHDTNQITINKGIRRRKSFPLITKKELANLILDEIKRLNDRILNHIKGGKNDCKMCGISHENLDKIFHYIVPKELESKVKIGLESLFLLEEAIKD